MITLKSYNIHLIRHGDIEQTKAGAYIGVSDPELSVEGREELIALDGTCRYPYAPVVFSGPLRRCLQTCEIIYPGTKPIVIEQLSEVDFGAWEGKTAEELKSEPDFKRWLAGEADIAPPGGENSSDFTRRICRCFEQIAEGLMKTGTTDCAIITHGGVIMTLMAVYALPQAKPFEWACNSGCGYSLRLSTMLWSRGKVCEAYAQLPADDRE